MRKPILEIVNAKLKRYGGAEKVIRDMRPEHSWDTIAAKIEEATKVRVSGMSVLNWVKAWDEKIKTEEE